MSLTSFATRVLAVVRSIPPGRVATYGDVAAMAGRARAARAVGNIMRGCADPSVPCHRVVAAGGQLGGYGQNPGVKQSLLRAEGIAVHGRRIRQFSVVRWANPRTTRRTPLRPTMPGGRQDKTATNARVPNSRLT